MSVTPQEIDFTNVEDRRYSASGRPGDLDKPPARRDGNPNAPRSAEGKLLTPKQIRARARRKARRGELMSEQDFNALFKPIEEWDLEELARGRTRNAKGKFSGPTPKWINREVHERSMERFKAAIRTEMNAQTPNAITALEWAITNDEVDEKGRYMVPPSVKMDAAKFLLEHVVGKPTQRIESDVSVKLQSILGVVMGNPAEVLMSQAEGGQGYNLGHLPGVTMPMATSDDIVDADIEDDDDGG